MKMMWFLLSVGVSSIVSAATVDRSFLCESATGLLVFKENPDSYLIAIGEKILTDTSLSAKLGVVPPKTEPGDLVGYQIEIEIPKEVASGIPGKKNRACPALDGDNNLFECTLVPIKEEKIKVMDPVTGAWETKGEAQFSLKSHLVTDEDVILGSDLKPIKRVTRVRRFDLVLSGEATPFPKSATINYEFSPEECKAPSTDEIAPQKRE